MSDTTYTFDDSEVETVDQESIEKQQIGFPNIGFHRGDVSKMPRAVSTQEIAAFKAKTKGTLIDAEIIEMMTPDPGISWRGGFYVTKEDAANMKNADFSDWKEDNFSTDDGKQIAVFYKPQIEFVQVERRRRWDVKDQRKTIASFPWNESRQAKAQYPNMRLSGHMQALLIIKGLESCGAFCLGASGFTQIAWFGESEEYRDIGVLSRFSSTILAAANAHTRSKAQPGVKAKEWDIYKFWQVAGASTDADGKPKFYVAGKGDLKKSVIVPVSVGLPAKADQVTPEMLGRWQTRGEISNMVTELRERLKTIGWKEEWATASNVAPVETPTTMNGHAVSQAVKELL